MATKSPIIRIVNATFYRHHPQTQLSQSNPSLFNGLNFEIPSSTKTPHNWCIVGPSLSGKTTFLRVLRGKLLSIPPGARSFPHLSTDAVPERLKNPQKAIQYVGFDSEAGGLGGATASSSYLSARYESRREITDFSLKDFLLGNTELNPSQILPGNEDDAITAEYLKQVTKSLGLEHLLDLPVTFLSNGQGRRARIARALLTRPEVLLLDEPFMGLDPPTVTGLSPLLESLAARNSPRLVMTARPQDPLPAWITHLLYLRTDCQIGSMGPKEVVLDGLKKYVQGVQNGRIEEDMKLPVQSIKEVGRVIPAQASTEISQSKTTINSLDPKSCGHVSEALVEMDGCRVQYGDKVVLGNWSQQTPKGPKAGLIWTVRRGERWAVLGPNGSGKTTIVSLLCSDHPQTYSLPIKLFGRSRLPEPGSGQRPLTFWDIYRRVGHSSPEVHQHMPRRLTIKQVVENAWADTFLTRARLDEEAKAKVTAALNWFEPDLNPNSGSAWTSSGSWEDNHLFGELSFSAQRVALFLRSMIKNPDLVVLDESFSGMDEALRDKCMLFLHHGEAKVYKKGIVVDSEAAVAGKVKVKGLTDQQALICIAHVREEVPDCVDTWLCLPEANTGLPARFGRLDGPMSEGEARWNEVWGLS